MTTQKNRPTKPDRPDPVQARRRHSQRTAAWFRHKAKQTGNSERAKWLRGVAKLIEDLQADNDRLTSEIERLHWANSFKDATNIISSRPKPTKSTS